MFATLRATRVVSTLRAVGVAFGLLHASSAVAAISIVDDAGRPVTLDAPVKRVVALAPFLTEIAFEVGSGAKLVGVSEHSDWPQAARALPRVGNAFDFSLERIAALHPDLVLVWQDSYRAADLERLERLGARAFVLRARRLDDVPRALDTVARLTGGDAREAIAGYRAKLGELRARHARTQPFPVLLEIWHQPLTTVSGAHYMNEALAVCGARNAFDDLPGVAPVVPWEEVYRRDPPAIVAVAEGITPDAFLAFWRARPALAAVKSGRLALVPPDALLRPSARLADGIARLCDAIERLRSSSN